MSRSNHTVFWVTFQSSDRSNGAVESITRIIESMDGIDSHVFTNVESPVNKRWIKSGARVSSLKVDFSRGKSVRDRGGFLRVMMNLLRTNWKCFQLARTERPEIVQINDMNAFWYAAWGGFLAGSRIVLNVRAVHDSMRMNFKWMIAYLISYRVVLLSSDMVKRYSSQIPDFIKSKQRKLVTIGSIVEIDFSVSTPNPVSRSDDTICIGLVGSFNQRKNQLGLLESIPISLAEKYGLKIEFIGDFDPEQNDYCRKCLDLVERRGLQGVVDFKGYSNDVFCYYNKWRLTLICSTFEGMARCMIESICCGTPVVSSEVASAREILEENRCGKVVSQGDWSSFWNQVFLLLENDEAYESLVKNGLCCRHMFSKESISSRWMKLVHSQSHSLKV